METRTKQSISEQAKYRDEAVERYGRKQVEESEKRVAALSKEAIADLQNQWFEICSVIYERRDYGITDMIIQKQVRKLHQWVNNFWVCNIAAFRNLGKTYNSHQDFRTNIIKQFGGEMPAFLEQVVGYYCDNEGTTIE